MDFSTFLILIVVGWCSYRLYKTEMAVATLVDKLNSPPVIYDAAGVKPLPGSVGGTQLQCMYKPPYSGASGSGVTGGQGGASSSAGGSTSGG